MCEHEEVKVTEGGDLDQNHLEVYSRVYPVATHTHREAYTGAHRDTLIQTHTNIHVHKDMHTI